MLFAVCQRQRVSLVIDAGVRVVVSVGGRGIVHFLVVEAEVNVDKLGLTLFSVSYRQPLVILRISMLILFSSLVCLKPLLVACGLTWRSRLLWERIMSLVIAKSCVWKGTTRDFCIAVRMLWLPLLVVRFSLTVGFFVALRLQGGLVSMLPLLVACFLSASG